VQACRGTQRIEIAQSFYISVKTVSTYRARVLEKMNLDTNADLTAYAAAQRLESSSGPVGGHWTHFKGGHRQAAARALLKLRVVCGTPSAPLAHAGLLLSP